MDPLRFTLRAGCVTEVWKSYSEEGSADDSGVR